MTVADSEEVFTREALATNRGAHENTVGNCEPMDYVRCDLARYEFGIGGPMSRRFWESCSGELWWSVALKRRQGRLGDSLDEVFVAINGERQYLWRAVDKDGDVIDILVQPLQDGRAARRFFRKLLKSQRGKRFVSLPTNWKLPCGTSHSNAPGDP